MYQLMKALTTLFDNQKFFDINKYVYAKDTFIKLSKQV